MNLAQEARALAEGRQQELISMRAINKVLKRVQGAAAEGKTSCWLPLPWWWRPLTKGEIAYLRECGFKVCDGELIEWGEA